MDESGKDKLNKFKTKLARYCAYRERTQQEILKKSWEIGLQKDEAATLLDWLVAENFVNEERFARVFVRDKFYLNKWGRNKIRQGLAQKSIGDHWVEKAMSEIDEADYQSMLQQLMARKLDSVKADHVAERHQKTARFLIGKGYESDLVWKALKNL